MNRKGEVATAVLVIAIFLGGVLSLEYKKHCEDTDKRIQAVEKKVEAVE